MFVRVCLCRPSGVSLCARPKLEAFCVGGILPGDLLKVPNKRKGQWTGCGWVES